MDLRVSFVRDEYNYVVRANPIWGDGHEFSAHSETILGGLQQVISQEIESHKAKIEAMQKELASLSSVLAELHGHNKENDGCRAS